MSGQLSKTHLSGFRKNLLLMTNNYIIAVTNFRDKVMGRGYSPHNHTSSFLSSFCKVKCGRTRSRPGHLAQLVRMELRTRSSVGWSAALTSQRSQVQVLSRPPLNDLASGPKKCGLTFWAFGLPTRNRQQGYRPNRFKEKLFPKKFFLNIPFQKLFGRSETSLSERRTESSSAVY